MDMAIWDALAKAAGVPLARLLWRDSLGAVPCLQQQRALADQTRPPWHKRPRKCRPKVGQRDTTHRWGAIALT